MGSAKKAFKKLQKISAMGDLGHQVVKGMGLPDPVGDIMHGDYKTKSPAEQAAANQKAQMELATKAQEDAMAQQTAFNQQAQLIAGNQAGLEGANAAADTTKFELGGDDVPDDVYKRRRSKATGSTSSQLGIS